jgi:hypothetical protein
VGQARPDEANARGVRVAEPAALFGEIDDRYARQRQARRHEGSPQRLQGVQREV